ncbi:hypothetical protein HIM_11424 [Hirsutella minnesotensis 3608]|uniref:GH16 domain-containing protein n=1 Tax=Hirsutella minnesotensis 3608 TaxID=1043627 RepID=A0A0F7ZFI3_9HYPO|nr:hypothetical protein HIM_11424 [Hirsutella minnesotensis 3608]
MAPSLGQLSTAVLAVAGGAAAERFKLADSYDYTNFFEKFNWMTHPDYNNGHVKYQSLDKALEKGIAAINGKEIYLGVDHTTKFTDDFNPGRPSFRIESKAVYGHGLIVGRFNHMPKPVCGSWPALYVEETILLMANKRLTVTH